MKDSQSSKKHKCFLEGESPTLRTTLLYSVFFQNFLIQEWINQTYEIKIAFLAFAMGLTNFLAQMIPILRARL